MLWLLFVALVFPAAFAGYAVGHYTSLGKPSATVTETVGGSTSTSPTTTSMTTTTSSSGGNAAAGKTVFTGAGGCSGCHTFQPAGSSGTTGPDLDTKPAADAKADGNMALAAFIKQSIVDPSAYLSPGYSDLMPHTFSSSLSKTQIDDLVAFILSGTQH